MAFPSNAQRAGWPYGVRLQIVPPSSELVSIEVYARQIGTTNASTWLATVGAQEKYAFQHDLPYTTQQWGYKARSIAPGKIASTFTREIIVRPTALPYIAIGQSVGAEPVLGNEYRVRVTGLDCRPFSHTTIASYFNSIVTLTSGPANIRFGCSVSIPVGARMTGARSRGRMLSAGAASRIVTRVGITNGDGGYFAFGGDMIQTTTSYVTSTEPSPVTDRLSTDQSVAVRVDLISTAGTKIPEFSWVDIYYTVDSYRQLRS